MKIVALSDTHSKHRKISVPDGDVLVHAGDITWKGELSIMKDFSDWLKTLPHAHKIIIFGNHELGFQAGPKRLKAIELLEEAGAIYLEDKGVEINGKFIYGSPWQPWFYSWEFNLHRGEPLARKWALIPDNTNVLITHGPAYGFLDTVPEGSHVGCEELIKRIQQLPNLQAHVSGHIHHSYGVVESNGVKFVNASNCTEQYSPDNIPIVFEI